MVGKRVVRFESLTKISAPAYLNAIELRILIGVTTRDYPYKINELRRGNPLWLPLTQWH